MNGHADDFRHLTDAELLAILGIYARLHRQAALTGGALDATGRRKHYRLARAAYSRGLVGR